MLDDFDAEFLRCCPEYPEILESIRAHYALLIQWNARLNLTRITDPRMAARRHYAESLKVGGCLLETENSIVDLGSGAGFPGIPLAIAFPGRSFSLVESDLRKCVFLKEATRALPNVRIANQRDSSFSGNPDCVVSRAVAWDTLSSFAFRMGTPLVWITSEAEFEKSRSSTWNVEQRIDLPESAGIVVRMFHEAPHSEVVG